MSEEKHSWDRVPAWDGDKRQWKRYLRDAELYLLIGKDTLKVLEARFDVKNNIGFFQVLEILRQSVARKPRRSLDGSIVA